MNRSKPKNCVLDSGDVLYICPLCNPLAPAPHKDCRALLMHVNKFHRPVPPMLEETKDLFQIAQCEACHEYYGIVEEDNTETMPMPMIIKKKSTKKEISTTS